MPAGRSMQGVSPSRWHVCFSLQASPKTPCDRSISQPAGQASIPAQAVAKRQAGTHPSCRPFCLPCGRRHNRDRPTRPHPAHQNRSRKTAPGSRQPGMRGRWGKGESGEVAASGCVAATGRPAAAGRQHRVPGVATGGGAVQPPTAPDPQHTAAGWGWKTAIGSDHETNFHQHHRRAAIATLHRSPAAVRSRRPCRRPGPPSLHQVQERGASWARQLGQAGLVRLITASQEGSGCCDSSTGPPPLPHAGGPMQPAFLPRPLRRRGRRSKPSSCVPLTALGHRGVFHTS